MNITLLVHIELDEGQSPDQLAEAVELALVKDGFAVDSVNPWSSHSSDQSPAPSHELLTQTIAQHIQ